MPLLAPRWAFFIAVGVRVAAIALSLLSLSLSFALLSTLGLPLAKIPIRIVVIADILRFSIRVAPVRRLSGTMPLVIPIVMFPVSPTVAASSASTFGTSIERSGSVSSRRG